VILKNIKDPALVCNPGSQKCENSHNQSDNCQFFYWFFDENCRLLKTFETTETNNSLILMFFQRIKINYSLLLKIKKIRTDGSLKIQIPTQHC
jgi:hypothetical protein